MEKEFQKFPVLNSAQKQQLIYLQVEFCGIRRNIRKMKIFPLVFLALLCGCAARIDEINFRHWLLPTRPEEITVSTVQTNSFIVSFYESPQEIIISTNQTYGFTISILRFRSSGNEAKDIGKMKVEAAKRGANHIVIERDTDKNFFRARLYRTGDAFEGFIRR